jgi:hypothetical protein
MLPNYIDDITEIELQIIFCFRKFGLSFETYFQQKRKDVTSVLYKRIFFPTNSRSKTENNIHPSI